MMDTGLAKVPMASPPDGTPPRHRLPSPVWLIPVIALALSAWLGWSRLADLGPVIEVSFAAGDGLLPGQTRVRHKAVELGRVSSVQLSPDLRHVVARIRMRRDAAPLLTDNARFWVVRPRVDITNISGLETLVSGAYVELDPGSAPGAPATSYHGLSEPPAVRSGEPGRSFRLHAERIGALSSGSPVFFRDVPAGEVLGVALPENGRGPATVEVFIRAPFDGFVRAGSRFWNASAINLDVGADGFRLSVDSLRTLLAGGVAFEGPPDEQPVAQAGAAFTLHVSREEAQAAGFARRIPLVTYLETPVRGLSVGAPVEMLGLRVGAVTDVSLSQDIHRGERPRVRVRMEVQPERVSGPGAPDLPTDEAVQEVTRRLVALGMRARPRATSLLTGQLAIALDLLPDATPAETAVEPEGLVIPGAAGAGLDDALASATTLVDRVAALPLDRLLADAITTLQATGAAAGTADAVMTQLGADISPALREARAALGQASRALSSLDRGYGADSATRRDVQRAAEQAGEAARSVRILADFLSRHPDALLRGRTSERGR
jgi:paraquat-inducible protein B